MQKKPHPSPINNKHNAIDWNTKVGNELTHGALEAAQDASTSLDPVQCTQLVIKFPPHPSNYHYRGSCRGEEEGRQYPILPNMYPYGYDMIT